MKVNGVIIAASNPAKELEEYVERIDRAFGSSFLSKPCAGCSGDTDVERLNSAGQCRDCGPADPPRDLATPAAVTRAPRIPRHLRPAMKPLGPKGAR